MDTANISISITEGRGRLIIDGPLDLFQKFLTTLGERNDQPTPRPVATIPEKEPAVEQPGRNSAPAVA
jgi:hypothetical protein